MKIPLLIAALLGPLSAAEKSGHAEAELLCGVTSYKPGSVVPVAIRLKIEPGWHSYWINPGVGGMPLKATWTLPEGWKAGELKQPLPKRFMTGELPGFGYEGEPVFLVNLTPPEGATGEATCQVKLSWLTCNDSACVPGNADLSLTIPAGDGKESAAAVLIDAAGKKIPLPLDDATTRVTEADGQVVMTFSVIQDMTFEGSDVFPATPDIVDPAAPVIVKKTEEGWTATAPKNEYAEGPATEFSLVFSHEKFRRPLLLSWKANK